MKPLLLLVTLFAFSCTSVEIPNDLPAPETSSSGIYWCVYINENRCEKISFNSLADCSGDSKYPAPTCPDSFDEQDDGSYDSGDDVSPTRCKDNDGNDYFCHWNEADECWGIDPTYSKIPGATCASEISTCRAYGLLYINSTEEGPGACSGTRAN